MSLQFNELSWCKLQSKCQVLKEVPSQQLLPDFLEMGDLGGRRWSLLRKRLRSVSGLHFPDVFDVARVEELRAIQCHCKLSARPKYLADTGRDFTAPVRPDHHIVASVIPCATRAYVTAVVEIVIAQHNRIIALRVNRGNREDNRLRTQIHPDQRAERIVVRQNHGRVLVAKDAAFVLYLVEGCFEFA